MAGMCQGRLLVKKLDTGLLVGGGLEQPDTAAPKNGSIVFLLHTKGRICHFRHERNFDGHIEYTGQ